MPVTVTRIRPPGIDANGDPIAGSDDRLDIAGCSLAPLTSTDINDRSRAGVVVGMLLIAPFDADIVHTDRIEDPDGSLWEVDGEVGRWQSRWSTWKPGLTVALKRAAG
jgi:hypothetical protein